MQIKKGDKFKCIRTVNYGTTIINPYYCEGKEYTSEEDDCITDEYGNVKHYWRDDKYGSSLFDMEGNKVFELIYRVPQEYIDMRGLTRDVNYVHVEGTPQTAGAVTTNSGDYIVSIKMDDIRTFDSGAVRDSNKGKSRPDLISPYFTNRLGYRLAFGIEKGYGAHNWEKGIPDEAFLESLERHLVAYKMGKTDEDHAGAIAFNIMGIIHNEEVRKLKD